MRKVAVGLVLLCAALTGVGQDKVRVPAEVAPFVERGTKAIALEAADLNGDATQDFVLVLEKANPPRDKDGYPVGQRSLLVLVRGADGKLVAAKRNEQIVMCSECGGAFGDPFAGIAAGRNTFTVTLYGGSNWRWGHTYKFNYSRIDKTWQLVRVEESSFHTSDPQNAKTKIYTPPNNFGKIDIADFDPENFLNKTTQPRRK